MAETLMQMRAQFPDPFRQAVVDMLWQNSRLIQFVNFIPHTGFSYPYAQKKALPGIAFRGVNAQFTPSAAVINPAVEMLSILGGKVRTDNTMIATKGVGIHSNNVAAQVEACAKAFDKYLLIGDPANDGAQFLGLKGRLTGSQLLSAGATAGATMTAALATKLLDAVNGPNPRKVLVMNQTDRRNLEYDCYHGATSLATAQYVRWLNGVMYFRDVPVIEVFYDETETLILGYTETYGTSNACCSSAYCVIFGNEVDERDVQAIMGLPQRIDVGPMINFGEYVDQVVQMVVGLGVFGGYSAARLQGLIAA